jgi:hypothetical protein
MSQHASRACTENSGCPVHTIGALKKRATWFCKQNHASRTQGQKSAVYKVTRSLKRELIHSRGNNCHQYHPPTLKSYSHSPPLCFLHNPSSDITLLQIKVAPPLIEKKNKKERKKYAPPQKGLSVTNKSAVQSFLINVEDACFLYFYFTSFALRRGCTFLIFTSLSLS